MVLRVRQQKSFAPADCSGAGSRCAILLRSGSRDEAVGRAYLRAERCSARGAGYKFGRGAYAGCQRKHLLLQIGCLEDSDLGDHKNQMRLHVAARTGILGGLCFFLMSAVASGSTQEQVAVLFAKAHPAVVTFSDGTTRWTGQTVFVGKLDNGVVVVKARYLALDTDGASKEIRECDSSAQPDTALSDPDGKPADANVIPVFCASLVRRRVQQRQVQGESTIQATRTGQGQPGCRDRR